MAADGDLAALGRARAAFGLVFLLRTTPLLGHRFADAWPLLGWPDGRFHLPLLVAAPAWLVAALCVARTLGALGLLLGVRARASGIAAGACGYAVLAQDVGGYFHHLHLLFAGAILFGLTDGGARAALLPTAPRAPRSSVLLIRAFTASIYGWAALGKLRRDWLDGRTLLELHREAMLRGPLVEKLVTPTHAALVARLVVASEIAIAVGLLVGRTRLVAVAAALLLHAGFELSGRVDSIGWEMVALLVAFVPLRQSQRADGAGQATTPSSHISSVSSGPGST